jgi:hypothetical protein
VKHTVKHAFQKISPKTNKNNKNNKKTSPSSLLSSHSTTTAASASLAVAAAPKDFKTRSSTDLLQQLSAGSVRAG